MEITNRVKGIKVKTVLAVSVILSLILIVGSFGCAASTPARGPTNVPTPAPAPAPAIKVPSTTTMAVPRPAPAPTTVPSALSAGAAESAKDSTTDRMIVRTGKMSLVVQDIAGSIDQITRLAESYKGYVVSSNSWREGERLRGTISIRVPVGDFGNVMKALSALAVEVTSQTTTSQDVTEEYVDLGARLHNLEATEQQLLQIMQKAQKVEDVLAVQRELTNVRGNIEQAKARMQYLERTSASSLITVTLEQSNLGVKFSADRRFVNEGTDVQFTSQVVGGFAPYSYQWEFGDGSTSHDSAPRHGFKSSGSYTVTLKVTDNRGNTATESTKDYITVQSGWNPGDTASSAWNGFVIFGHVLTNIFIWLGIFSPVWIVIGGILWWRRRHKKTTRT